jgi:hypothetical protein
MLSDLGLLSGNDTGDSGEGIDDSGPADEGGGPGQGNSAPPDIGFEAFDLLVTQTKQINASSGQRSISYSVSGCTSQINSVSGLFTAGNTAETCTVTVTDTLLGSDSATINVHPALTVNRNGPTPLFANSLVNVTASGGLPPYTYNLDSGMGTFNASTGLFATFVLDDTSVVRVTDSLANTTTLSITSSRPQVGPGSMGQAPSTEHPWHVRVSRSDGQFLCSGSLISARVVLTAAACVEGFSAAQLIVTTGVDLNSGSSEVNARTYQVISFAPFPSYNSMANTGNLAIVRIPDIDFATGARPILLPDDETTYGVADSLTLFGWWNYSGSNNLENSLHGYSGSVVNTLYAQGFYGAYDTALLFPFEFPSGSQSNGTCGLGHGDGVVTLDADGNPRLVGLGRYYVNFDCSYPQLVTRLIQYLDWFNENAFMF